MNTRTFWAAAATVVAVALLPACSSDSDTTTDTSAATTTSAEATTSAAATTSTAAAGEAPVTAETLQAQMDVFFDPAAPVEDKAAVIENGDSRTDVLTQFNGVLAGYPLTATVGDITAVDDTTVTATTEVGGPHGGAPMPLTFTEVDGTWVLADASVCSILAMGQLTCE
ncbi:nuclear transport factor 2 family protein [Rhodococcus sp. SJ-3]|uniref:nuclear transport factor 2 family protein n=1 Tax=Rhodococcus sp. SJ-3 TaxID=3454628 RepID=UPI003F7A5D1E